MLRTGQGNSRISLILLLLFIGWLMIWNHWRGSEGPGTGKARTHSDSGDYHVILRGVNKSHSRASGPKRGGRTYWYWRSTYQDLLLRWRDMAWNHDRNESGTYPLARCDAVPIWVDCDRQNGKGQKAWVCVWLLLRVMPPLQGWAMYCHFIRYANSVNQKIVINGIRQCF